MSLFTITLQTRRIGLYLLVLLTLLCSACSLSKRTAYLSEESAKQQRLSDESIEINASAEPFHIERAVVITDNDSAFESKLEIIRNAERSLDLAYYIYADDYSSSLLTKELIAAAKRGVRVRLLVDYHSNYKRLDPFFMMERFGNTGKGSFEVRLYNRPTDNIIKDAVYVTLGCGEVGKRDDFKRCSKAKFAEIEKRFAEHAALRPPSEWV